MKIDKEFKNIFLVGPSRCGKTTTATIFQREYGYTHIIMDAIIETMMEIYPNLGIKHGNLQSEEFINFLKSYSKNLFKYTKHNIIDLEVLDPIDAKKIINEDESTIIYMGYPNITPEEKLAQTRKYDSQFDWTRNMSDGELLELFKKHIETSKLIEVEAKKYGYKFIDTSFNRENRVKQEIQQLIEQGELYRTNESYKRYYR